MTNDIKHILFPVLICHSYILLLKLPFKCLAYIFVCPYFFLSWKSSAYIWINPLLCIYLANIFPPVCSLFFKIFLEYLLKRHFISKVFWCNLIYPFFFFFLEWNMLLYPKKSLTNSRVRRFSPRFSSRNCIVLMSGIRSTLRWFLYNLWEEGCFFF